MKNPEPILLSNINDPKNEHSSCMFYAYFGTPEEACDAYRLKFKSEPEAIYNVNNTFHIPITGEVALKVLNSGIRVYRRDGL
jgi:hypothetical protein